MDLGGLEREKESLISFLSAKLEGNVASSGSKVMVNSEDLSSEELKRIVNKFVYHQKLNNKYWVALEGDVVKINKFKRSKEKEKRNRNEIPPSTIKHGW